MRLNSVSIKRYRSIEDAGLAACGGFNVLIGRNNSGKSNILSALRAFFACAHDGVATITPPIRQQIDYFNRDTREPIEIQVELGLTSEDRTVLTDDIGAEAPQVKNAVDGLDVSLSLFATLTVIPPPQSFAFISRLSLASSCPASVETGVPHPGGV